MDFLSNIVSYFYESVKLPSKPESSSSELEDVCQIEPTLTPNSMAPLPDNKYIIEDDKK